MAKTVQLSGFPGSVSADTVKEFLERYTGEGTVYAIKVRQHRNQASKSYATVQFTSAKDVESIIFLPRQRLRYGWFYIKARVMEVDIVPKPRTILHRLQNITLYFGCQVSREKFSVLWKEVNVSVEFGNGLRQLHFYFKHQHIEYKLQLSYENLWQIQLQRPRREAVKYLLIQLLGAPRIYKKDVCSSSNVYEGPFSNFFKDTLDDQWVRAIDFTPSCCIGQSSSLCLELPSGPQLPNFRENFAYYKENGGRFSLEPGSSFSCSLDLVPIVGPPLGVDLPYGILFKINSLLQHGCLTGPTLDVDFYRMVDPRRNNIACIEDALDKLYNLKECCYEPSTWLNEQYRKNKTSKRNPKSSAMSLDDGLVYVRRVQITPCKVYFYGPEKNISNRVLRNYPNDIENFLRVSFVDEELDKMYSTDLSPCNSTANEDRKTELYGRILSILRNGIVIGEKKFEFLAFSSSQLRENSTWMFAPSNGITAVDIRAWMGDFRQIRNVAKYAARLGQSFGSSTETLSVGRHEIEKIPDIEVEYDGVKYAFSDGIGKISSQFARKVALKCGCHGVTPSAFQIRYGGYKGVVAVDPTSSFKLSLRTSMCKYESDNIKLDVLAWSKFRSCFLNRQLINLLSTLGVEDQAFQKKQRQVVQQLDAILIDPLRAQDALDLMPPGENTNILKELLLCGYKPDAEPYLSMMLQTFRASKLLELRMKTRIYIPNGRALMGCLDETGTLEYGQVFVQFSASRYKQFFQDSSMLGSSWKQQPSIVKGRVVVAKNPCLHPGDVRVLKAVDVPALHHMVDCVVFPQKGPRPHPNECSGSDLDGDIYFVCWDSELIPPTQIRPMDYTPAPSLLLDHDVTMEEVQEYFANYIVNDSLGIIANAHTVFADKEYQKAKSSPCIELARLFSIAVDFPKTGIPAIIPHHLHVKEYPDFMEKLDKPTYESQNVIGKLYREVKDIAPHTSSIKSFTYKVATDSYDHDMEVDGFEDYIDDAFYYKGNYDYKLGNLLDYYGIKTEAEIISGNIMRMKKPFSKRRDLEAINMAVRGLRKEARNRFNEKRSGTDYGADDVYAKASAWYHVTYHPSYWGSYNEGRNREHYLSFAWCVYDKLVRIKRDKANIRRRRRQGSFLEDHFRYGLHLR
ncbi:probable RNA-dependent RNA polymerase 1 isoform X1 [Ziziphus jujuba]|uniref:RNA-dependent RNA polymerase n=2 Tax=Ziziphus jujuba TaxID=326968 RepID=A0ABM3I2K2_ZIZJJ|nr:probable RNA-dependent RNA polymerase 1 isoform X1 [Ziziphus jujuba]